MSTRLGQAEGGNRGPAQQKSRVDPQLTRDNFFFLASRRLSAYAIEPIKAFYVFLVANLIAAAFAPIQDCDETFNYWEPTHYLSHGYGLQTWEYSPDYSIRSWLYVALHSAVGSFRRLLPRSNKVRAQEFPST